MAYSAAFYRVAHGQPVRPAGAPNHFGQVSSEAWLQGGEARSHLGRPAEGPLHFARLRRQVGVEAVELVREYLRLHGI